MHLSTAELAASWMLELFGEIGGGVLFSSRQVFLINAPVKSFRAKIVLVHYSWSFLCFFFFFFVFLVKSVLTL